MMTSRERFRAALEHRAPDRAPMDLGGTPMTGIRHPQTLARLRRAMGLPAATDALDEPLLQALGVDFRRVGGIVKPANRPEPKISETEYVDFWGLRRKFTGLYWERTDPPLRNATRADLDAFPWPDARAVDEGRLAGWREQARRLYEETETVVCAEHPVYGVFELACWLCGFDDLLARMAEEPEFVRALFDRIWAHQESVIASYYGVLGEFIHVTTSGDDFGTQQGPFMSPPMFGELIQPYLQRRIAWTRRFTRAAFFHHTCGAVFPLIPHLLAAGVDILNPIQPGVRDMEPGRLKAAFGDRLTFWGGIDTQHLLVRGTPAEVEQGVRSVLAVLGKGGGYVLAPAHNIQPDVPPENLLALYAAGREISLAAAGRPATMRPL